MSQQEKGRYIGIKLRKAALSVTLAAGLAVGSVAFAKEGEDIPPTKSSVKACDVLDTIERRLPINILKKQDASVIIREAFIDAPEENITLLDPDTIGPPDYFKLKPGEGAVTHGPNETETVIFLSSCNDDRMDIEEFEKNVKSKEGPHYWQGYVVFADGSVDKVFFGTSESGLDFMKDDSGNENSLFQLVVGYSQEHQKDGNYVHDYEDATLFIARLDLDDIGDALYPVGTFPVDAMMIIHLSSTPPTNPQ